ncbi:MAG: hypothetical protein WBA77_23995 [Microcoleaceae cyanobacterium]
MTIYTVPSTKNQIISEFKKLLEQRNQLDSKVATKEEEAEQGKGKKLLEKATNYTIDSIVKGLADLQLDFGTVVLENSDKLKIELLKLDELKQAIEVENQQLEALKKVRIVADALYLLTQEHREKLTLLEQNSTRFQEELEKEKKSHQKVWEQEQQAFETQTQAEQQKITATRQQEEEDYNYEQQRLRQIEQDEYEEKRRNLERELQQMNQEKVKDWTEREGILEKNKAEFEKNKKSSAGSEEELKQAEKQARETAIQEATREAKVKADLVTKEWEATQQGYELQVSSLEETIQRQNEQITDLSTQLQATMAQAQELALRAFSSSSNGSK